MIETKEQIIEHFESGSKDKSNLKIGVEHEKFIFDKKTNTRIDYPKIKKMFENLYEFGWKPIFEEKNPIALTKNGKSITLEPGNQIELSGAKLNNIHEACAESQTVDRISCRPHEPQRGNACRGWRDDRIIVHVVLGKETFT